MYVVSESKLTIVSKKVAPSKNFKEALTFPIGLFVCAKITDFYLTSLSGMKHASPWMELLTRAMFECTQQKVTSQTLHFWGGICGHGILLGPYFFEGNVNGGKLPRNIK